MRRPALLTATVLATLSLPLGPLLRARDELHRSTGRRVPLLVKVHNGTFIDTLYYRLNTVCLDLRS